MNFETTDKMIPGPLAGLTYNCTVAIPIFCIYSKIVFYFYNFGLDFRSDKIIFYLYIN